MEHLSSNKLKWKLLHRLRYRLSCLLSGSPLILFPLARMYLAFSSRTQYAAPVTKKTKLVIEGFPRSGNTFAVTAFRMAQTSDVVIGHHLHASAQIVAAVRCGIPCLVLVRNPRDAVLSFLVRAPWLTARLALQQYIHFYSQIEPMQNQYVIATFEQIISNFGLVIEQINKIFNTDFNMFEYTQTNVNECFSRLDLLVMQESDDPTVQNALGYRPKIVRGQLKNSIAASLEAPELVYLLDEAQGIYTRFRAKTEVLKKTPAL